MRLIKRIMHSECSQGGLAATELSLQEMKEGGLCTRQIAAQDPSLFSPLF